MSVDQLALDHLAHLVVRTVTEPLEPPDAVEEPVRVGVHVVRHEAELVLELQRREDQQEISNVAVA